MVTPMVQNVHPHRDPMVTPVVRNVHSHLVEQPTGRNIPNEPPIGSISKRLDDMLSTPFCSHISITSPQGDSSYQNFPHTMEQRSLRSHHALSTAHDARYWQRCTTMQSVPRQPTGQALSWFHRLPPNSVGNFRDLCEAFVGQYLCSLDTSKISAPYRT
ncbi:hypothetical protein CK203_026043 [Vitis vinifera]|uniref:Retrotransposon gag domain-containing protein n=1 Tax=Vitis vinifera TaxID=29760 RepID=A0A438IJB9_VITVI|nr:hypothetical protein CK203_026043 [Vitis vinifera]